MFNKLILKIYKTRGELFFINEHNFVLSLNKEDFTEFFNWYLNQDYNFFENRNAIYNYVLMALAKAYFSYNEMEELLIESKYFESIPEDDIYDFLYSSSVRFNFAKFLPLFVTYLTSKITSEEHLIRLTNFGCVIDMDCALRKLVEIRNIEKLITFTKQIYNYSTKKDLFIQTLKSNFYSFEDIKNYIIKTDLATSIVVDVFADFYKDNMTEKGDLILDTLIKVASTPISDDSTNKAIDTRTNETLEGCEYYAYEISYNASWTKEMKIDFAKKLLASKNHEFIYYWLSHNTDCPYNYEIIDAMLKEDMSVIIRILAYVNDTYLEYVVMQLVKDKNYITSILKNIYWNF